MANDKQALEWTRVMGLDELSDGRVKPVTCHHRTLCMTHYQGQYAALDGKGPHLCVPDGAGAGGRHHHRGRGQ